MLIILGTLILTALFFFLTWYTEDSLDLEILSIICFIIAFVLCCVFIFASISCSVTNINKEASEFCLQQEQQIIEYKVNHLNYFMLSYNDTINEIKDWNEKIIQASARKNSIWWNWFYPLDYSQFKIFELK